LYDEDGDRDQGNAQHLSYLNALAVLRDRVGVAETGLDVSGGVVAVKGVLVVKGSNASLP